MAIQPTVETLDAVDESLRGAYVETAEGKFEFDLSKYDEIVKAPLVKKNRELLDFKTKHKPIIDNASKYADLNDEEYQNYQQWKESRAKGGEGNQPNVSDAVKKAVEATKAEFGKTLSAKDQELQGLVSAFQSKEINERLVKLAIKAGIPEDAIPDFVEGRWRNRFGLENFDIKAPHKSDFVFYENDGTPSHLSPEDAIKQVIRKESPRLFGPSEKGGAGSNPLGGKSSSAGAKTMTRAEWEKLSAKDSSKFFADGGRLTD